MAIKIQNSTIIDDGRNIVNAGITTVTSVSIGNTQVISSSRQLQNIASLDATTTQTIEAAISNAPNTFTDINVTGVSTFTNGPVLIGSGTSTGTSLQRLQVTGNAYVSGDIGIGTTSPTAKLHVVGSGSANAGSQIAVFNNSLNQSRITIVDENASLGSRPPGVRSPSATFGLGLYAPVGPIAFYGSSDNEVSRFDTSGNLLIGNPTSTGTSLQNLQVTGGGYFSGNVGLGRTNPIGRLHIPYSGTFGSETLRIGNEETTFSENIYSIFWGSFSGDTQTGIGPYPTTRGVTGRQGLGIHIKSTDEFSVRSTGWANLFGVQGGTGNCFINGNLGIGLTNPTSKLQVVGNAFISGTTTSTTYDTGVIGSQTSGILTTTATTANQVLDNLPTATFQTARYQVSIACTGQLVTAGMSTIVTSVGAITAGAGYTEATYTNVALTGGSGNDARANIGIGLSFNAVGFTSATDLIVTTTNHGLPSGVGTIAVSFASSIPNSDFTGIAVTAGAIYYAVGVGTTTLQLFNNANGTSQVTGIGTTTFTGVGNTMTKAGGVSSVEIVSPGSGYSPGNTLSATLGTLGSGFSFTVATAVRNYQSTDIMIMQSVGSASTACDYIEYGTIANSEVLGSFAADISGANARLLFTPTYRNNTIKLVRTGITV